jgi:hypothetical protein
LFGVFEKNARGELAFDDASGSISFVSKLEYGLLPMRLVLNFLGVFSAIALEPDTKFIPFIILVREEKLGNPGR